ncbi:MAG: MBL fold metallo-hydrolase [Hyphomicrobiaceae bacterium]
MPADVVQPAIAATGPVRALEADGWRADRAFKRYRVGTAEVTSLLDAISAIDDSYFPTATPERASALRDAAGLEAGKLWLPINVFVIDFPDKRVMIDAGNNRNNNPSSGRLREALAAAGIDPASIDTIVVTHAHIDHITGLLTPEGEKIYPGAEIIIPRAELEFWSDETKLSGWPHHIERVVQKCLPTLRACADQFRPFDGTPEVLPGLTAVPLPGHSPAQTGYMLRSGGDSLLFWADTVHLAAYQLPEPGWAIVFDYDQSAAVETRKRTLEDVVNKRQRVAGAHLPGHGIGRVERSGSGYLFTPDL